MALFRVAIQKPVMGKSHPSEAERQRNRRVVLVEAKDVKAAATRVMKNAVAMADTTGEIVSAERIVTGIVLVAP